MLTKTVLGADVCLRSLSKCKFHLNVQHNTMNSMELLRSVRTKFNFYPIAMHETGEYSMQAESAQNW